MTKTGEIATTLWSTFMCTRLFRWTLDHSDSLIDLFVVSLIFLLRVVSTLTIEDNTDEHKLITETKTKLHCLFVVQCSSLQTKPWPACLNDLIDFTHVFNSYTTNFSRSWLLIYLKRYYFMNESFYSILIAWKNETVFLKTIKIFNLFAISIWMRFKGTI